MSEDDKKYPKFTGTVQEGADENYQRIGKISIWENNNDNPKAPIYTGTIETEKGKKYKVSLWGFIPKSIDEQEEGL